MYNSIKPGQIWLDTNGERIQAHGGSVIYLDGVYYWYGENKEKTTGGTDIWHWGIKCYASRDLYNWEDKGLIIPPELNDTNSPLHPTSCIDRPHIIYNEATKKFVCWLKICYPDYSVKSTILTADNFLGPYTIVREGLKPFGMNAADFDLAVSPDDGKAYYYFERVHTETICADLTDDYTDVTGYYSTHFPRKYPPFVREAPAHFMRNSLHYLVTSGTTGYYPNPSEIAVAESWHGPFKVLGNPHPKDSTNTSYHSQISCIFKVHGKKDLYVAIADRWLPQKTHLPYEEYARVYERAHANPTVESLKELEREIGACSVENTSISDYVWLPFRFDGEMGYLDWLDEWRVEDYD